METRNFYVYAWYAKTTPKRYFYVGKGTGKRYTHILNDIKKFRNGTRNIRFQRYCQIQDKWGIDYEILHNNLTEAEALDYEQRIKLEFLKNGEILLCIEGMPDECLPEGWYTDIKGTVPSLHKDPFFERYFDDYTIPYFDKVEREDLLKTYIYPYFVSNDNITVMNDKASILNWLNLQNAKIYKTVSVKTKSIIVQGYLMYEKYLEFRNSGKKILSSKEIIDYIRQPLQ